MISQKQLIANRKNARKGGVKTEAGKALVRLNALKHGLLCREVLLPGEDNDALTELRERIISEVQPQGELEMILTERIVSGIWRLKRTIRAETNFL